MAKNKTTETADSDDINIDILKDLIAASVEHIKNLYPCKQG